MTESVLGIIPHIDIAGHVEAGTASLASAWSPFFNAVQMAGNSMNQEMTLLLQAVPPALFLFLCTAAAWATGRKDRHFGFAVFTGSGLWLIYNQGLWPAFMETLALVLSSSFLSILIGVPVGILMARSDTAQSILAPVLDFMQTMPAFVYLIPAVAFFGIGVVPGILASLIFALPPTVRMTNLGIRQVPKELTEAARSFGSTGWQRLCKLDLPAARSTIMAGMNQTVMLSLSMVVIASMIGAPGLGREVLSALQRAQVGNGFTAGLGIVIMAIMIDRFAQRLNRSGADRSR